MPELLLRPSGLDAALMDRALTSVGRRPRSDLTVAPRLVVNAHLASRQPQLASVGRRAGIPVLVDPQTPYLQQTQHDQDRWARLPFAQTQRLTPADIRPESALDLAGQVITHQITHGGTHLLTPYLHIPTVDSGWLEAQLTLYRATRTVLDNQRIRLPVIAVVDVGWRLLDEATIHNAFDQLLTSIAESGFTEIALTSSTIDRAVHPERRLLNLLLAIHRARQVAPVIAWNQGRFGELCVAAGALGYETGIGWRERSDTPSWSRSHNHPPAGHGGGPRPVYIDRLSHSIPKATVAAMVGHRSVSPDLPCAGSPCCRNGLTDLLHDSRHHTIYSRVRSLRALHETAPQFRWAHLAARTAQGLDLANRINAVLQHESRSRIDNAAIQASHDVAALLQATNRVQAA